jgi:DNA transformation protein and related proteins
MAKRAARHSALAEGGFGAFVLDQLSGLDGVEAKPMFGGAGFYLNGVFFGILYKDHLYFHTSKTTIPDYTKRKMKPFTPFEGKRGSSKTYYEVPVEILESPRDLVAWARKAARAAKKP